MAKKTQTVLKRRNYEYDHQYGLSLQGKAVKRSPAKAAKTKRAAKKR